jgi:hypothetical protein
MSRYLSTFFSQPENKIPLKASRNPAGTRAGASGIAASKGDALPAGAARNTRLPGGTGGKSAFFILPV